MIIKGFGRDAHYDFSEEEIQKLHQIVEELKNIFNAESVGLMQKTLYADTRTKNDWVIEIKGVPSRDIPQW